MDNTVFFILLCLALLPTALLLDVVFGEPPLRMHPLCFMGTFASKVEAMLSGTSHVRLRGSLAVLLVIVPVVLGIGLVVHCGSLWGGHTLSFGLCAIVVWLCLAPRSLSEHALAVAEPLRRQDLDNARCALAMMVGRDTKNLDPHATTRACVESVAENTTDGVLASLFWASVGLVLGGFAMAAAFCALHRIANMLDAMWGHKNSTYMYFGTAAARLDDMLGFIPARLALPCVALASCLMPKAKAWSALNEGFTYRNAHASPNSAWSEAAFAGALGLRLGGPALYSHGLVEHPWLGTGSPLAEARHIILAVQLMWYTSLVCTFLALVCIACFLGVFLP